MLTDQHRGRSAHADEVGWRLKGEQRFGLTITVEADDSVGAQYETVAEFDAGHRIGPE